MRLLQRALIEKIGYDNGFENLVTGGESGVTLGSARHSVQLNVQLLNQGFYIGISSPCDLWLCYELRQLFPDSFRVDQQFFIESKEVLSHFFYQAAKLARSLSAQVIADLESSLSRSSDAVRNTEMERLVQQRVGQNIYRKALLDYWEGRCAVTGVALVDVLRASHIKPWAECLSDHERLDVFNGLLLTANLDALFDRFLISFGTEGNIMISCHISTSDQEALGLHDSLALRWVTEQHEPYLSIHRERMLSLQ